MTIHLIGGPENGTDIMLRTGTQVYQPNPVPGEPLGYYAVDARLSSGETQFMIWQNLK